MTGFLIAVVALLLIAVAVLASLYARASRHRSPVRARTDASKRILFPFVAHALSQRALDAALRLARADDATLVPVFLARVSLQLPLDTPLPRQSKIAMSLQDVIEQRASKVGVAVDARVERGRSYRHALRQTIAHEQFERIVIAASSHGQPGFDPADVAWLLDEAPGEIVVLRPDPRRELELPATSLSPSAAVEQLSPRPEAVRSSAPPLSLTARTS